MQNTSSTLNTKTLKIIWAGLTFSVFIYGFVAPIARQPDANMEDPTLVLALMVISASNAAVALLGVPAFIKLKEPQTIFTRFIVQWALLDSVAIMGFIAFVLGGPGWSLSLPIATSIVFMIVLFPSDSTIKQLLSTIPNPQN